MNPSRLHRFWDWLMLITGVQHLLRIITCVIIIREGRNKHLDVKFAGGGATWNPHKDKGWQAYATAQNQLYATHRNLPRVLKALGVIP